MHTLYSQQFADQHRQQLQHEAEIERSIRQVPIEQKVTKMSLRIALYNIGLICFALGLLVGGFLSSSVTLVADLLLVAVICLVVLVTMIGHFTSRKLHLSWRPVSSH